MNIRPLIVLSCWLATAGLFAQEPQLAVGARTVLAVGADGHLFGWGLDADGEIGVGSSVDMRSPAPIAMPLGVIAVAAGAQHALALTADGQLWSWGANAQGQLGSGTTQARSMPTLVGIGNLERVAAGRAHSLAIRGDGAVLAWGDNSTGEVGDGTTTPRLSPVALALTGAVAVDGGDGFSVAVDGTGGVWTWGVGSNGQLGTGSTASRSTPGRLAMTGFTAVAAGSQHVVALKGDGTVWTWGVNTSGQLGQGDTTQRASPTQVTGLDSITAIAAGTAQSYAVRADGSLWSWGANAQGQLGDGTTSTRTRPVQVPGITAAVAVQAGDLAVVRLSDGSLVACGTNDHGQIGDRTLTDRWSPTAVGIGFTLAAQAAQPSSTPSAGHWRPTPLAVALTSATSGSSIAITTDRTMPNASSTIAPAGNVSLPAGATILRARASASSLASSAPYAGRFQSGALAVSGWDHSAVITPDGRLFGWGLNGNGQIGDGTVGDVREPRAVPLTDVVAVATGQSHTLAATGDGQAWSWGANAQGQLGSGSTTSRSAPAVIAGLTAVTRVAAGSQHSLALTSGGSVYAWGANNFSQLGDGTTTPRMTPVALAVTNIVAIDAGDQSSIALDAQGWLWSWGSNAYGQLGTGDQAPRPLPTRVGVPGMVQVDAGLDHVVALDQDGLVWAWGANASGQVGDGTTTIRLSPSLVTGLDAVVSVAAGQQQSYAVRADGSVWAWGLNSRGQLGDGTTTTRLHPVQVPGISSAVSVAGGDQAVVLLADGTLVAFGQNDHAQLGDGTLTDRSTAVPVGRQFTVQPQVARPALQPPGGPDRHLPLTIAAASSTAGSSTRFTVDGSWPTATSPLATSGAITLTARVGIVRTRAFASGLVDSAGTDARYLLGPSITCGRSDSAALAGDGTLWAWGLDADGELGDGTDIDAREPRVVALPDVISIAMGDSHTLAATGDGRLWAWGKNLFGQLGDGTTTTHRTPTLIAGVAGVRRVSAGVDHSLALTSAGSVLAWGLNNLGQLGDGTTTQRLAPTPVAAAGIVAIKAGNEFSVALDGAGVVWSWGYNGYGQLGTGDSVQHLVPVRIGLSGFVQVEAGDAHVVGLLGDGSVWTWGNGQDGELGLGDTNLRYAPQPVAGLANIVSIAAGPRDSFAVRADGTLWAWGANDRGQLGDGTTTNRLSPVQVPGVTTAIAVAAGEHTLVLRRDGTVVTIGRNDHGQLGDETLTDRSSPTSVGNAFTLEPQVAAPVLAPAGGHDRSTLLHALASSTTSGASITFTTDRSAPTAASTLAAGGAIDVATPVSIVRTRAFASGLADSAGRAARYQLGAGIGSGYAHGFALGADGSLWGWGANDTGQIGDGSLDDVREPRPIGLANVIAVAAGRTFSAAVTGDGQLWTWGANASAQLGALTPSQRSTPAAVAGVTGIRRVAAGVDHGLALRGDGVVLGWGDNLSGQVGDGTQTKVITPKAIAMTNAVAIDGGDDFSVALDRDGGIWTWGSNSYGQLGTGDGASRLVPTRLGISGLVQVDAGSTHVVALAADGRVWTWGNNASGQLGLGDTTTRLVPLLVPTLGDVVSIAAGEQQSYAVRADGTVWAWGLNDHGQLGDGTTTNRLSPMAVPGISTAITIAGGEHAVVLLADGSLVAFGRNDRAQLGDGTLTDRTTPIPVGGGFTFGPRVAMPTALPDSGSYPSPITATLSSATSGASIRFTTDHSVPTSASTTAAGGAIAVGAGVSILRARAFATGLAASDTRDLRYQIGPSIVSGWRHTLALRADGVAFGWGNGSAGQIGDGGIGDVLMPRALAISGLVSLACGQSHSLAAGSDGRVWAWGDNSYGQLGVATSTASRAAPAAIAGVGTVVRVGAGITHSLAIRADGVVVTWGSNRSGELGDGTTTDRATPAPIAMTDAVQVDGGDGFSVALDRDGAVWTWGTGTNGQIGNNGIVVPTRLGLTQIVQIDAGSAHLLALRADGSVLAWGNNASGQLGLGRVSSQLTPVTVPGLDHVVSIAAGVAQSYAVRDDGTVWAWGLNDHGQLGDGTTTDRWQPVQVPGIADGVIVAAGEQAVVLRADGSLLAFGRNDHAQLGDGTLVDRTSPEPFGEGFTLGPRAAAPQIAPASGDYLADTLSATVTSSDGAAAVRTTLDESLPTGASPTVGTLALTLGNTVVRARGIAAGRAASASVGARLRLGPVLASGWNHTLGLAMSGRVAAWGADAFGQLGDGGAFDVHRPWALAAFSQAIAVATGELHSLVVTADGSLWSWGANYNGQLGSGDTVARRTPAVVTTGIRSVAAGKSHSLALRADGSVIAWGLNDSGQLGDGTVTQRLAPVATGLTQVVEVAAGQSHSIALTSDGFVWCWGDNTYSALGTGAVSGSSRPVRIGLANVVQIAAGAQHTLALSADGIVWSCGYNAGGQLGTSVISRTPQPVLGLDHVVAIGAGEAQSYAIRADGTVWAWGANQYGQLGDGTTTNRSQPVRIPGITDAVAVVGGNHTLILRADGTVLAVGHDDHGQLGDDGVADRSVPVELMKGLFEAPHALTVAVFSPPQAVLTWRVNMAAIAYEVQRRQPGGVWATIATVNADQYVDTGVTAGVTYEWQVRENDGATPGPFCASVQATIPTVGTAGTSVLTADAGGDRSTEGMWPVALDASRSAVTHGDAVGYHLSAAADGGTRAITVTGGLGSFLIGDAVRFDGSTPEYRVDAVQPQADGSIALLLTIATNPGAMGPARAGTPIVSTVGAASGYVFATDCVPGDTTIRVTGGAGAFAVDDRLRFVGSILDYRVTAVATDGTAQVLGIAPIGLIVPVAGATGVAITTEIVAWDWQWQPDGTWRRLGEGRQLDRPMRATDSDSWAYTGTTFTDTWGRPPGRYPINLTVTDSAGRSATAGMTVSVVDGAPPVANAGSGYVGGVNGPPVFFDGRASTDDTGIVDYWWDVDTSVNSDGQGGTADDRDLVGPTPMFTYTAPGTYTVKLTVRDGRGHTSSSTTTVQIVANLPPQVSTVAWRGKGSSPHPIIAGVATRLKAVARDAPGVLTYRWTFPDGSQDPPAGSPAATVGDPYAIESTRTFTGGAGTPLSATLQVWDASGAVGSATYRMLIVDDSPVNRADLAIDEGLWFLHKQQHRTSTDATWGGWSGDGFTKYISITASALQAFGIHGNRPFGDPRDNPYVETVEKGFKRIDLDLVQSDAYAGTFGVSGSYRDPVRVASGSVIDDGNGRNLDIQLSSDGQALPPYELAQIVDAFAATGMPLAIADRRGTAVDGRRTVDLVRDMLDTYAWGQSASGGWRYGWGADPDNSVCQWGAIGMTAAQQVFGIYPFEWVKTRNRMWLDFSYDVSNGTFGYMSPGTASASSGVSAGGSGTSPSGLVQMAWQGAPQWDPRWAAVETNIRTFYWMNDYKRIANSNAWDFYGLYALTKAMRVAHPRPVRLIGGFFDWYEDPTDGLRARLIAAQNANGSWTPGRWLDDPLMGSAWSIIMLSPHLFIEDRSWIGDHAPIARAKSLVVPTDPGAATAAVTLSAIDAGSSDPDGDAISLRLIPAGPYPVGVNHVSFVATDPLGLASTVAITITVEDREAPRLTPLAAVTIATDPGRAVASATRLAVPTASDNVGLAGFVNDAPADLPLGTSTVTWTASDAAGNRTTATQAVTVVDREAPTIIPPASVVVALPDGQTSVPCPGLGQATTHDNVRVTSVTNDAPATLTLGTTTVTWTARDAAGNQAQATQLLVVQRHGFVPSVTITSPGDGITFAAGSTLHLTAEVADAPASDVLRVVFLVDGAPVGASSTPPHAAAWPQIPAGIHVIAVQAFLRTGGSSADPAMVSSPPHTVTVVTDPEAQP